jgi:branched-chain amino acid transport system permease protein
VLLLQLVINGLQLGAIYALTALGFSLIFGATKIFMSWSASALIAVMATVVFGLFMERFIYRPIQRHQGSFFTVFIAAFGVQIIVQNAIGTLFGRGFVSVTTTLSHSHEVMPGLFIAPVAVIAIVVAIVFFTALTLYLSRTHTGTAMRALSENADLIRVFGLEPGRVAQYAFAIGSAIVVPGAILTAMTEGLNPAIGNHVMLISLAATIVGGIGSLRGAACGGLLLGLAENLALWRLDPQWSEAVTFVVLFLFIVFRPAGFFGRLHGAK